MDEQISLGEYIRRLRRARNLSLYALSEQTGLSYSHLSRIETNSTVPGAGTVAKLAETLEGNLKSMLEMADCLPRAILDRITARDESQPASLHRTAGDTHTWESEERDARLLSYAADSGLNEDEAAQLASAVAELVRLEPRRRSAVTKMLLAFQAEDDDAPE